MRKTVKIAPPMMRTGIRVDRKVDAEGDWLRWVPAFPAELPGAVVAMMRVLLMKALCVRDHSCLSGMSKKSGGVTDCDAGDTCSRTPQISRRAAQTHPRRFYFVWTSKTGVCLINLQRALVNNLWWLSLWRKASRPRTIDVKTVRLTATHSHGELEFFSRADL